MNQSGKQKEEMDKILDIKTYINKDVLIIINTLLELPMFD